MIGRILLVAWLLLAAGIGRAEPLVWEKYLAPGLTYRMEFEPTMPRVIHALRYSQGTTEVRALPELSDRRVFAENATKGRLTVTGIVAQTNAIAGINADFFPWSGDPIGMMVRARELVSAPYPNRSVFAWGPDYAGTGKVDFKFTMQRYGEPEREIGYNEETGESNLVLYTPAAGITLARKNQPVHALFRVVSGAFEPNGTVEAEFTNSVLDPGNIAIPKDGVVLTGSGAMRPVVRAFYPGERVTFRFKATGFPWEKVEQVVAGGPNLLTGGAPAIDTAQQGFPNGFGSQRHPRTAVGRTRSGDLWFVTVDGRQSMSVGASLPELAAIMSKLGCSDAINLDGGGSTTLNVLGLTLNRPSDGQERPVASAVVFLGPKPEPETAALALPVPAKLTIGETAELAVRAENGAPIPNAEVLWWARGAGWIDQGGTLRTHAAGTVWVRALVRGRTLSGETVVLAKPAPKPPPKRPARKVRPRHKARR
ncbi:MAG: phosphodiester glycosidase family protein [Fimbriimonadaceae bacterium]|nr:phosphodiester glycosidase family protein [Fimbriimonadaceae bacterium]